MIVHEAVRAAVERDAQERKESAERSRQYEIEHAATVRAWDKVKRCVRPAIAAEYAEWLQGYLENGGRISHVYEYPFPTDYYFIARRAFIVPELYGASSKSIIVPEGVNVRLAEDKGHNTLYKMEDFQLEGGIVPIYTDVIKLVG